ncbi:MAG: RHS repeat-associated core domain-containing protein, partial [Gammaproteobacteria bacterium]
VTATAGVTVSVPHAIWMPKLDAPRMTSIASPTREEIVLKHPKMPSLEIQIPAGTIIRDRKGKIVTRIGITPVPLDRAPFPVPALHDFRVYYTIQPAGAALEGADGRPRQAKVVYPNYGQRDPGEGFLFWSYDPHDREWHVYGEGRVSADGNSVICPSRDLI